jgi:hypothetical protein
MSESLFSLSSLVVLSIASTFAALMWSFRVRAESFGSRWLGLTALPGLLALASFFSFAVHMHSSLGGWPDFCGTYKLPRDLFVHYQISGWLFSSLLVSLVCMPLVLALFAAVPHLRPRMIYPACFSVMNWLCFFTMLLAPVGFLDWWWD